MPLERKKVVDVDWLLCLNVSPLEIRKMLTFLPSYMQTPVPEKVQELNVKKM